MKTKLLVALITILIVLGVAHHLRPRNSVPNAHFEVKPKYINPTDQTLIRFVDMSTDPDNDLLIYAWFIDGKLVNRSRNYSGMLPVGSHTVELVVSDREARSSFERVVTVESSSLYGPRELLIPIKGICYNAGIYSWQPAFKPPEIEEMIEDLEVIRCELGCNAIRIFGDFETDMLECARQALSQGFKVIALSPRYIGLDTEETERRVTDFARKVQHLLNLAQPSTSIVLFVGNELTLDTKDLADDRRDLRTQMTHLRLNRYLEKVAKSVRAVFDGTISYAAGIWEDVQWDLLPFDVVALNVYLNAENHEAVLKRISDLQRTGRPMWITEFGSCTYQGAFQYGGMAHDHLDFQAYSQEEQAAVIEKTLKLLNEAKVNACFLYKYKACKPDDRGSYGILRFDGGRFARKLSFYLYKSYLPDSFTSLQSSRQKIAEHIIQDMGSRRCPHDSKPRTD